MTSQNHETEGSSNFMSGSSSCYYHYLAKFDGHRYCSRRKIIFLVCHVFKQDYVIKGSDDHNDRSGWEPPKVNYHPTMFSGHRHCGIAYIMVLVCCVTFISCKKDLYKLL